MQDVWQRSLEGRNLFDVAAWEDDVPWTPFQPGVEIHRLYGDGAAGPSAALLRFQAGGRIPAHTHTGYEHILVLRGSQTDEDGLTTAGGLRLHPPGTRHHVFSEAGCLVLAVYEKPVSFAGNGTQDSNL